MRRMLMVLGLALALLVLLPGVALACRGGHNAATAAMLPVLYGSSAGPLAAIGSVAAMVVARRRR